MGGVTATIPSRISLLRQYSLCFLAFQQARTCWMVYSALFKVLSSFPEETFIFIFKMGFYKRTSTPLLGLAMILAGPNLENWGMYRPLE